MAWTAAHKELLGKIAQEMEDYICSIWNLPSYAVLGNSDEIIATLFCYNQMVGRILNCPVESIEWLLQYEKPLETVRSHWMAEQDMEFETEFDRILREWGDEEPESSMDVPGMS